MKLGDIKKGDLLWTKEDGWTREEKGNLIEVEVLDIVVMDGRKKVLCRTNSSNIIRSASALHDLQLRKTQSNPYWNLLNFVLLKEEHSHQ